jgi:dipeptidase D
MKFTHHKTANASENIVEQLHEAWLCANNVGCKPTYDALGHSQSKLLFPRMKSVSSSELSSLSPKALWQNFSDICAIPHPSRHEAALIQFLQKRAEAKSLTTHIDETGNLLVSKPAHPDHAHRPGVILQGHVDMVPQANSSTPFDFTKDPIQPRIDGQWVKATGTTLGADNGIAVATMLAIMEDDSLQHGPLEFVFTVEKEVGLTGAMGIKPGLLNGSILLNLDSEEDGDIVIGCAGGRDVIATTAITLAPTETTETALHIAISGLKGGHSGCDIHLGRGNAIRILTRLLRDVACSHADVRLHSIAGGSASNAIPREAEGILVIPAQDEANIKQTLATVSQILRQEFALADPDLSIDVQAMARPDTALTAEQSAKLLRTLNATHDGVSRMSDSVDGMPETSCNLGILATEGNSVIATHKIRSNVNSARDALSDRLADTYMALGSEVTFGAAYPGWAPKPDANILQILDAVFTEQNGKPANITTMHAGLECGLLGATYPHWEMAAIGPTIRNPHSPDECVDIASVERFWDWLLGTLQRV